MPEGRTYSSRSAAVAAARAHCKLILGAAFCAYEGHDYLIHPVGDREFVKGPKRWRETQPCKYELQGPAKDMKGN